MDKQHTNHDASTTSRKSSTSSIKSSSVPNNPTIVSNIYVTPTNCVTGKTQTPRTSNSGLASVFERQNQFNQHDSTTSDSTTKSDLNTRTTIRTTKSSLRTHKSIKLESTYGLFDTISLFLGIIIGSGIFISAKIVAETTPNGGVSILVWLGTGFYSILGALCFAELGTTFPESGGDFAYLRRLCGKKYGDLVAFLRIWVELLILRPGSQAAIAVTVAKYLIVPFLSTQVQNLWVKLESSFGPENTVLQDAQPTAHPMVIHAAEVTISIIITVILTIINIFSIKATQFCNALLSGIKIFLLLGLATMGIVCISQVRMLCPIDDDNSQYLAHYFECDYKNVTLMTEVAGSLKDSMVAYLSPDILFDFTSWQGFSTVQIMGKISIACYAGMWSYAGWSDVNYREFVKR